MAAPCLDTSNAAFSYKSMPASNRNQTAQTRPGTGGRHSLFFSNPFQDSWLFAAFKRRLCFLQGSELEARGLSIIVSPLYFSACTLLLNDLRLSCLCPRLFWGWIFLGKSSLLAASVSHLCWMSAGIFSWHRRIRPKQLWREARPRVLRAGSKT